MGKFEIGDIVRIDGYQNSVHFNGQIGKIVGFSQEFCAVDFVASGYFHRSFHDLEGIIETNTGFWIETNLITPATRKPTGFGQFIRRVENV